MVKITGGQSPPEVVARFVAPWHATTSLVPDLVPSGQPLRPSVEDRHRTDVLVAAEVLVWYSDREVGVPIAVEVT